jgi:hypothetical protein
MTLEKKAIKINIFLVQSGKLITNVTKSFSITEEVHAPRNWVRVCDFCIHLNPIIFTRRISMIKRRF